MQELELGDYSFVYLQIGPFSQSFTLNKARIKRKSTKLAAILE